MRTHFYGNGSSISWGRWRASAGGGFCLGNDELNYAVRIVEHVPCADSQGAHTLFAKPCIPAAVVSVGESVALSVDFNAKLFGIAIEIEHIRASGMLPSESKARPPIAQGPP